MDYKQTVHKDTIIAFFNIIHRHVSYLKQRFGDWTRAPSPGKKPTRLGPIDRHQNQHKEGYKPPAGVKTNISKRHRI
jgi:hypothetical protein